MGGVGLDFVEGLPRFPKGLVVVAAVAAEGAVVIIVVVSDPISASCLGLI